MCVISGGAGRGPEPAAEAVGDAVGRQEEALHQGVCVRACVSLEKRYIRVCAVCSGLRAGAHALARVCVCACAFVCVCGRARARVRACRRSPFQGRQG